MSGLVVPPEEDVGGLVIGEEAIELGDIVVEGAVGSDRRPGDESFVLDIDENAAGAGVLEEALEGLLELLGYCGRSVGSPPDARGEL